MGLLRDQKQLGINIVGNSPVIYTTGAYLVPMLINKGGKLRYVWVVEEFHDDTFNSEGELITAIHLADSKDNMIE